MQDPNPLPWGAQDRFQAHFIVRRDTAEDGDFVARTVLDTRGRFGSKRIVSVRWNGGKIANALNADVELNGMIAKWSPRDATIFIEPTGAGVRIRGKWRNHIDFVVTDEIFRVYDRIAGHVKAL